MCFRLAEGIEEIKGLGLNFDKGHVHIDTRKADERLMWVIKDDKKVELDESNKSQFIPEQTN